MKSAVILFIVVVMLAAGVTGIAANQPSTVPPYVAALGAKIDMLNGKVGLIGTDVLAIKGDVASLTADVSTIESDVATLKSDVADLKAELANVPRMESYHDRVSTSDDKSIWKSTNYESGPWATAHFHVTIHASGLTTTEKISVHMNWGSADFQWNVSSYEDITVDGVYTYDFDANLAEILTYDIADGVSIAYAVTVTYVNKP